MPFPDATPARSLRAILQRQIVKLHHGILGQKSHRAIFKLHFRASVVRRQHVTLPNRQIQRSAFPRSLVARKRIAVYIPREAHVPLHQAQSNDARVTGVSPRRNPSAKQNVNAVRKIERKQCGNS